MGLSTLKIRLGSVENEASSLMAAEICLAGGGGRSCWVVSLLSRFATLSFRGYGGRHFERRSGLMRRQRCRIVFNFELGALISTHSSSAGA